MPCKIWKKNSADFVGRGRLGEKVLSVVCNVGRKLEKVSFELRFENLQVQINLTTTKLLGEKSELQKLLQNFKIVRKGTFVRNHRTGKESLSQIISCVSTDPLAKHSISSLSVGFNGCNEYWHSVPQKAPHRKENTVLGRTLFSLRKELIVENFSRLTPRNREGEGGLSFWFKGAICVSPPRSSPRVKKRVLAAITTGNYVPGSAKNALLTTCKLAPGMPHKGKRAPNGVHSILFMSNVLRVVWTNAILVQITVAKHAKKMKKILVLPF